MDSYQYVLDAMMIPFDTWDMQSIRESNFLDRKMTFKWPSTMKKRKIFLVFFFMHLGRENQNSKMVPLPYQ